MNTEAGFPSRPPRERGTWRAFILAALMHALLALFLFYGMHWQNSTPAGAEAELWTEVPDMATPRPLPPPAPPAPAQPAPPVAQDDQADIALLEKKKRQQEAAQKQLQLAEQQRQQQLQAQQEAQQAAEAQRQQQLNAAAAKLKQVRQQQAEKLKQQQLAEQQAEKLKQEQAQQAAQQDQLKAQQDQAKQQKLKQAQDQELAQKKADQQKALKAKQAADQASKQKSDQERRARLAALQGMAGDSPTGNGLANGGSGTGSGGNAASPGYADKVKRRVRPNIRATVDFDASLTTVVSVSCAPDGALLSASVQRSSGNEQWDDVALRAVKDSDPMPRDVSGSTPAHFTITLRPKS